MIEVSRVLLLGVLLAVMAALAVPGRAQAQVSCSAASGTLAFGTLHAFAKKAAYASTTVNVSCVNPTATPVTEYACLSIGVGSGGGSVTARQMTAQKAKGAVSLPVALVPNTSAAQQVGDGTSAPQYGPIAFTVPARGGTGTAGFPLTAVIPAQTRPIRAGNYSTSFAGGDFTLMTTTAPARTCQDVAATGTRIAGNLLVTANDALSCSASAADGALSFPTSTLLTGTATATASASEDINVSCNDDAAVTLGLDYGLYASGTTRYMANASNTTYKVQYGLYQDSNHTTPWGNTASTEVTDTLTGADVDTLTVYGYVPSQTGMTAGNYSDTVTIYISY